MKEENKKVTGGEKTARAPYNFVPFTSKVLRRYQEIDDLPPHDQIDPELMTGEIHVTMIAETPVFVSDGKKGKDGKPDPDFFRRPNGEFALPGTTIRGMVRENMQILGFGLVRPGEDLEDYQIFFREMAASRKSTGGELKDYYRDVLNVTTNNRVSVPQNIKAGYLRKKGDGYEIQPVKGTYLRIKRKDAQQWKERYASVENVAYLADGNGKVKCLVKREDAEPGMKKGVLLMTGNAIRKPNSLYVFPQADEEAIPVKISKEDTLSYQVDWENRRNALKAHYDPKFWALPETGKEKPVFYLEYDGHVYFGMTLFLRIGYRYPLSKGLPERHKEYGEETIFLDYPYSILGFANDQNAYRSRVVFEDFPVGKMEEKEPERKVVLGEPKPSYYPGYVVDGKHYNKEEFKLRGYKQYWLKEANPASGGKENVQSILRPMAKGTIFRGVIRYKNLHRDELGLLLWALRLDEGCYQSIGMGKPYGFGCVKVTIDRVLNYDLKRLYSVQGFCNDAAEEAAVDDLIAYYDDFAAKELEIDKPKENPSLRSFRPIKEFLYIHQEICGQDEMSYMKLEDYRNVRKPLPSISDIEKRKGKKGKSESREGMEEKEEDAYAALMKKYGKKH